MLFHGEGRAFAGGAGNDKSIDSFFDLPVNETTEGLVIDSVFGGGCDQCGCYAAENGIGCHGVVPPNNDFQLLQFTDMKKPMQVHRQVITIHENRIIN